MIKNSNKPEWFEYWQEKTRYEITDEINKRIYRSTGLVVALISIIFAAVGYLGITSYIESVIKEKITKITDENISLQISDAKVESEKFFLDVKNEINEATSESKEYLLNVKNDINQTKEDFIDVVKNKIVSNLDELVKLELKNKINILNDSINIEVIIKKAISERVNSLVKLSSEYNQKLAPLHSGYGKYNNKYSVIIKYYTSNNKKIKTDLINYKKLYNNNFFLKNIQKCEVPKKGLWLIGINAEMKKNKALEVRSLINENNKERAYIIKSGEFGYDTYCYQNK